MIYKHRSNFKGVDTVRKSKQDIAKHYEALGYEAERSKDHRLAHEYFQQAEHWKKND